MQKENDSLKQLIEDLRYKLDEQLRINSKLNYQLEEIASDTLNHSSNRRLYYSLDMHQFNGSQQINIGALSIEDPNSKEFDSLELTSTDDPKAIKEVLAI